MVHGFGEDVADYTQLLAREHGPWDFTQLLVTVCSLLGDIK